ELALRSAETAHARLATYTCPTLIERLDPKVDARPRRSALLVVHEILATVQPHAYGRHLPESTCQTEHNFLVRPLAQYPETACLHRRDETHLRRTHPLARRNPACQAARQPRRQFAQPHQHTHHHRRTDRKRLHRVVHNFWRRVHNRLVIFVDVPRRLNFVQHRDRHPAHRHSNSNSNFNSNSIPQKQKPQTEESAPFLNFFPKKFRFEKAALAIIILGFIRP